jgi:hypothetical protein
MDGNIVTRHLELLLLARFMHLVLSMAALLQKTVDYMQQYKMFMKPLVGFLWLTLLFEKKIVHFL